MALHTVKSGDVPADGIPLSKNDAVQFQLNLLNTLAPPRNRFFTLYGPAIAGLAGGITSISISELALKCSGIGNRIIYKMFIPIVIVPSIAVLGLHKKTIRDNIIIQKYACPICYHIKSASMQVFFGSIYPALFGGFGAFALARKYRVQGIPPLNKKEIIPCVKERIEPLLKKLRFYVAINIIVGIVTAHMEAFENNEFNENFERLVTKLDVKERKLNFNYLKQ